MTPSFPTRRSSYLSVGLHALGVDDPAAGAALDPAHRVDQAVVAARAALLLPPWLGLHRPGPGRISHAFDARSEEHTSELQSLMRISYAVFCLNKKNRNQRQLENAPRDVQNK